MGERESILAWSQRSKLLLKARKDRPINVPHQGGKVARMTGSTQVGDMVSTALRVGREGRGGGHAENAEPDTGRAGK